MEERVRRCFSESPSGILQLTEVQQWCREHQVEETDLQGVLQGLVDSGELGQRTLKSKEDKEHTIYWLKKQSASFSVSSTSRAKTTPLSTPLSGSTKERLKRRSRQTGGFISPLLSSKRPRLEGEEEHSTTTPPVCVSGVRGKLEFSHSNSHHTAPVAAASRSLSRGKEEKLCALQEGATASGSNNVEMLLAEKRSLEAELAKKRETLRKLKMVKTYRSKNDLQGLSQLTAQWRQVAQEAAEVLLGYSNSSTHPPSMAQLLEHFHIDLNLIHYSIQDEAFY